MIILPRGRLKLNDDGGMMVTGCRGTDLPAFFTNPTSASTAWQISQQKQSGCQLLFIALITRPMMNSPWGKKRGELV